jgi:hypothetical protein
LVVVLQSPDTQAASQGKPAQHPAAEFLNSDIFKIEGLQAEFDAVAKKHSEITPEEFNNDDMYKKHLNEVTPQKLSFDKS